MPGFTFSTCQAVDAQCNGPIAYNAPQAGLCMTYVGLMPPASSASVLGPQVATFAKNFGYLASAQLGVSKLGFAGAMVGSGSGAAYSTTSFTITTPGLGISDLVINSAALLLGILTAPHLFTYVVNTMITAGMTLGATITITTATKILDSLTTQCLSNTFTMVAVTDFASYGKYVGTCCSAALSAGATAVVTGGSSTDFTYLKSACNQIWDAASGGFSGPNARGLSGWLVDGDYPLSPKTGCLSFSDCGRLDASTTITSILPNNGAACLTHSQYFLGGLPFTFTNFYPAFAGAQLKMLTMGVAGTYVSGVSFTPTFPAVTSSYGNTAAITTQALALCKGSGLSFCTAPQIFAANPPSTDVTVTKADATTVTCYSLILQLKTAVDLMGYAVHVDVCCKAVLASGSTGTSAADFAILQADCQEVLDTYPGITF